MKIALCLSGQPRGLAHNIPNLLEGLVNPSGITDIFIHAWFNESMIGTPFQSAQPGQSGQIGAWTADTVKMLQSLNPKKLLIEKPRDFEEFAHLQNLPSAIQTHLASNTYSVYKANQLKCEYEEENNFKYDLVIRGRVDCKYDHPHNIIDYLDPDWKKVLHVPYEFHYMRVGDSYPTTDGRYYSSMSDTFAYGTSEIVNKFCSVFPDFEKIHYLIKPFQYGECYFGYQTREHYKIPISMQQIKYHLSRG